MDQIRQYQRITEVKPQYYKTKIPFHDTSMKRIKFNIIEMELHYDTEKKTYSEIPPAPRSSKKGGSETSIIYVSDIADLF
jgi:hypothetical protein